MTLAFPKQARILRRYEYKSFSRNGKLWVGPSLLIHYRFGNCTVPRLGLTVTKKYGNAVSRNRFKRMLRESFRALYAHFPKQLEINIKPKYHTVIPTTLLCKAQLQTFIDFLSHNETNHILQRKPTTSHYQ
ncbi:MAG: ribonuclease P protein component [Chlamydiales bacterium]